MASLRLASSLLLVLFVTGCGHSTTQPPPPTFEWRWPRDPQEVLLFVRKAFVDRDALHYPGLLTKDFEYNFSAATDPDLATMYPNWGKDDETESAIHLFDGFINTSGNPQPGASRIDVIFSGVQYGPDPTHPDSIEQYTKVLLTMVDGSFAIPSEPETLIYSIHARHELYLVRGDAAVLDDDEQPIANRWYVRRWDDLSQPTGALQENLGPPSWGRLRALYR